jgi:hypothetical protein
MFEQLPVDRISRSYGVLRNALNKIAAEFTPDERAQLFHLTAAETYRLSVPMSLRLVIITVRMLDSGANNRTDMSESNRNQGERDLRRCVL